jgi:hypothetical protein
MYTHTLGWRPLAFHWSDNFYFYHGEALFAAHALFLRLTLKQ